MKTNSEITAEIVAAMTGDQDYVADACVFIAEAVLDQKANEIILSLSVLSCLAYSRIVFHTDMPSIKDSRAVTAKCGPDSPLAKEMTTVAFLALAEGFTNKTPGASILALARTAYVSGAVLGICKRDTLPERPTLQAVTTGLNHVTTEEIII